MSSTQCKLEFQTAFTTESIVPFAVRVLCVKKSVEKQDKVNVNFASNYHQANRKRKKKRKKKGRKKERKEREKDRKTKGENEKNIMGMNSFHEWNEIMWD